LIKGVVNDNNQVETGLGLLDGVMTATTPTETVVQLLIRPEDIVHDDNSPVKAEVIRRNFRGANILYTLLLGSGDKVQALVPSHCDHQPGEKIGIHPDVRHLVIFPVGVQRRK
jgi:iron(III) transport system ATP-binding protein